MKILISEGVELTIAKWKLLFQLTSGKFLREIFRKLSHPVPDKLHSRPGRIQSANGCGIRQ